MKSRVPRHRLLSRYFREQPENAAMVLMKSGPSDLVDVFRKIPIKDLEACLNLLPPSLLSESIKLLEDPPAVDVLERLSFDLASSILRDWTRSDQRDKSRSERLLSTMKAEHANSVRRLLHYPDGTIGSIMNPVPFSVRANITIQELLSLLRKNKNRYSRYIYVVDEMNRLEGVMPFKDAFYSEKTSTLSRLMTAGTFSFKPDREAGSTYRDPSWRKWNSIPVTNRKNELIGVLRYDVLEQKILGVTDHSESDIVKAGAAVGEVLQIAVSGAVSAFGFDERGDAWKRHLE